MSGSISFAISDPVLVAIAIAILQPGILWITTRLDALRGKNALQFLLSTVTAALIFLLYATVTAGSGATIDLVVGLLLLLSSNLLLLECWALLSRGYTLGMLLTLLRSGPNGLTSDELAAQYRGGDSIDWIMRHRLEGLIGARLVSRDGNRLTLSPLLGTPVVWLYRASIAVLGLRRSG